MMQHNMLLNTDPSVQTCTDKDITIHIFYANSKASRPASIDNTIAVDTVDIFNSNWNIDITLIQIQY